MARLTLFALILVLAVVTTLAHRRRHNRGSGDSDRSRSTEWWHHPRRHNKDHSRNDRSDRSDRSDRRSRDYDDWDGRFGGLDRRGFRGDRDRRGHGQSGRRLKSYFIPTGTTTGNWGQAVQICMEQGGRIATIKSRRENMALLQTTNAAATYWLGLIQATPTSGFTLTPFWRWIDGERLPLVSRLWAAGQPSATGTCATLTTARQMANANCPTINSIVCERMM